MTSQPVSDMPGWDRRKNTGNVRSSAAIQWKGSEICLDLWCICGEDTHVDTESPTSLYLMCGACERKYLMNPEIELVLLEDDESTGGWHITTELDGPE